MSRKLKRFKRLVRRPFEWLGIGLGWLVWLARIYMIIQGVGHVVKGEKKPLPFIGDLIK